MSEPLVLVEADGPILVVTINRPEKKNAANAEVLCRLYDAWVRLDTDDDLRVAVLTGKGDTFCAGMDLAEIGRLRAGVVDNEWLQRFKDEPEVILGGWLKTYRPTKPVILAAEGFARAGGTEILQGTDIRVAGESAVFGVTEVQRGLFPMAGSAVRLRRQVSYAVAAEMLLTGEDISAVAGLRPGVGQPRGPRRPGARQGPRDRRSHRPQRAPGREGHPRHAAPDRCPAGGGRLRHRDGRGRQGHGIGRRRRGAQSLPGEARHRSSPVPERRPRRPGALLGRGQGPGRVPGGDRGGTSRWGSAATGRRRSRGSGR